MRVSLPVATARRLHAPLSGTLSLRVVDERRGDDRKGRAQRCSRKRLRFYFRNCLVQLINCILRDDVRIAAATLSASAHTTRYLYERSIDDVIVPHDALYPDSSGDEWCEVDCYFITQLECSLNWQCSVQTRELNGPRSVTHDSH